MFLLPFTWASEEITELLRTLEVWTEAEAHVRKWTGASAGRSRANQR